MRHGQKPGPLKKYPSYGVHLQDTLESGFQMGNTSEYLSVKYFCNLDGGSKRFIPGGTVRTLIVNACFAGIVLAGSTSSSFAQNTCSTRCPDGSSSEVYSCNDPNYVPMCYRRSATASAPASAPAAPAALTPLQQQELQLGQQLGYAAGQQLHNWLFGAPTRPQSQPSPDPAQQQRELAAQQLNNSGTYLLKQKNYLGAIHEFQQALAQTPNDPNILNNLASAKQQLKDAAVAAQTSGALGQLLGKAPASTGFFDFDQLTHSSVVNSNVSALDLVNLNSDTASDASVVDLRDATKTSPESLKNQLDGVLGNASATAVPDSLVVLPQAQDIELLFQPPQSMPQSAVVLPQSQDMELLGQPPQSQVVLPQVQDMELLGLLLQSAPTHLKMDAEQQKKVDAIFAEPGGLDDLLLQKIQDDALAGTAKPIAAPAPAPAPTAAPATASPHN
jgi:tetratricopeptide (TPR) repeat protein